MAEPIILHANKPEIVDFPCPSCGRVCRLTPLFHDQGAARGVRHGNGVQHSTPPCKTYRIMTPADFLKLATAEVPILRDDVHVSVKMPEPPPLILVDGGANKARTRGELDQLEAQRHARDVEITKIEAVELAHVRDRLVAEERAEERAGLDALGRRRRWGGIVLGGAVLVLLALVVVAVLRR